jgi:hypothetical protein
MKGGEKQNYLFGPPISRRGKEAGEGEMEAGRGKKSKKWQLTLGVKDAVFAAFGIVGLLMMSFTLGALAGRGDIYRVAYSWGLLRPQANPMAQVIPQVALAPIPSVAGVPAPSNPAALPAPAPVAARPAGALPRPPVPVKGKVAAKPEHTAPINASVAALSAPAAAAPARKKSKAALARHERKIKEEQARRERLEMAKKLSFLNSLDSTPKFSQKNKTKATAKPQPPTLVRVGTYRDSKSAHAKMAELEKHGVKATVKQRKDAKGVVSYVVYRQVPSQTKEVEKVAENKEKRHSPAPSHKTQTN